MENNQVRSSQKYPSNWIYRLLWRLMSIWRETSSCMSLGSYLCMSYSSHFQSQAVKLILKKHVFLTCGKPTCIVGEIYNASLKKYFCVFVTTLGNLRPDTQKKWKYYFPNYPHLHSHFVLLDFGFKTQNYLNG